MVSLLRRYRVDQPERGSIRRLSAPGLGVGCSHGLGLRRPSLTQEDGQDHQREDRQKLALPVLEGLEPEFTRLQELQRRDGLTAMGQLLLAVLTGPTHGVQDKGEEEKKQQRDRQGVLVEFEGRTPI